MSILNRLWKIGKAYWQSDSGALNEEFREWEEEIKKRGRAKTKRGRRKKTRQSGYKDIAWAFQALGVDADVDFETCRRAYRKLAQKYHPDKWHNSEKREKAEELFKLIGKAFSQIKNFYGK